LYYHKLLRATKKALELIKTTHINLKATGVYSNLKEPLTLVLTNGFIIWIGMTGIGYLTEFWKLANPFMIIPYGVIAWWVSLYHKEITGK
jgi:membrane protein CcdC involved in cytochrome C biogenesis